MKFKEKYDRARDFSYLQLNTDKHLRLDYRKARTLALNERSYFVPFNFAESAARDGAKAELFYFTDGLVELKDYLETGISRNTISYLISQVVRMLSTCEDRGFAAANILLELERCYLHAATGLVKFIYLPVVGYKAADRAQRDFLIELVNAAVPEDSPTAGYIHRTLDFLRSQEVFSLFKLRNYLIPEGSMGDSVADLAAGYGGSGGLGGAGGFGGAGTGGLGSGGLAGGVGSGNAMGGGFSGGLNGAHGGNAMPKPTGGLSQEMRRDFVRERGAAVRAGAGAGVGAGSSGAASGVGGVGGVGTRAGAAGTRAGAGAGAAGNRAGAGAGAAGTRAGTIAGTVDNNGDVHTMSPGKLSALVLERVSDCKHWALPEGIVELGRAPKQGIAVSLSGTVGRSHATAEVVNDVFSIADKASKNGTFVNGLRLQPGQSTVVEVGSLFRLGDEQFKLVKI